MKDKIIEICNGELLELSAKLENIKGAIRVLCAFMDCQDVDQQIPAAKDALSIKYIQENSGEYQNFYNDYFKTIQLQMCNREKADAERSYKLFKEASDNGKHNTKKE